MNAELLDVRALAKAWGITERSVRGRVARRLIPFRKIGNRVVFLRCEIEAFITDLPGGCSLAEAKHNARLRQGVE